MLLAVQGNIFILIPLQLAMDCAKIQRTSPFYNVSSPWVRDTASYCTGVRFKITASRQTYYTFRKTLELL